MMNLRKANSIVVVSSAKVVVGAVAVVVFVVVLLGVAGKKGRFLGQIVPLLKDLLPLHFFQNLMFIYIIPSSPTTQTNHNVVIN
jgi:hypothetical protein